MQIVDAHDQSSWDAFLGAREWSPFLQSFTMGEVYGAVGQAPIRLIAKENDEIVGLCFGHVVDARRGKHIAVPYGPIVTDEEAAKALLLAMKERAKELGCAFVRVSPWLEHGKGLPVQTVSSPLHLLAEHVWFIRLSGRSEDEILAGMRKNTRNLVRRAEKDGVIIEASKNPNEDIEHFLKLHDETRKRHGFTPYTNDFFRAQVREFSKNNQCTLYLARHEGRVIASSIHMHAFGETSYHHGASEQTKVPASYLLQWTAIKDAMKCGDTIYNFWGIAPPDAKRHPFAGVTLFKTGFGGELLNLVHCQDIPVSAAYWKTYAIEQIRKWRRGF